MRVRAVVRAIRTEHFPCRLFLKTIVKREPPGETQLRQTTRAPWWLLAGQPHTVEGTRRSRQTLTDGRQMAAVVSTRTGFWVQLPMIHARYM